MTRANRDVRVTLGVGVVLIAAVVVLVASINSPRRVVRTSVDSVSILAVTTQEPEICQANEVLPRGVSAIRLWLLAAFGSDIQMRVFSGTRIIAEGSRGADWTTNSVTIPITPLNYTASHATVCIHLDPNSEPIHISGAKSTPAKAAISMHTRQSIGGRIGIEDLRAQTGSWLSRIVSLARHMGIGHALSGTWVSLLFVLVMCAAGALAIVLTVRELS